MKKNFLLLALGAVLSLTDASAVQSPRVVQGKTFITYGKSSKDIPLNTEQERAFTIDAPIAIDVFQSGAPSVTIKDFPVGLTETKTVLLRPGRAVADDETKWTVGRTGGFQPIKAPRVLTYEGVVEGEMKSKVFMTFFQGDLTGVIVRNDGQRFVVAPNPKNYDSKHDHILTSERHVLDQLDGKGFVCGNSDDEHADEIEKRISNIGDKTLASNELLEANVAVDITNSFYKRFNDYEKTQAYVISLFGMVSRIYEEEINVVLHLEIVNIWDDINQDPYKGLSSGHDLLPKMRDYWNANVNNPRNLAHLLSGPPTSSGGAQTVIGVAYLGKICQTSQAYGVSLIFKYNLALPALSYVEDVATITHEIGHTFGSPHTHVGGNEGYEPPIDSCMTSNPNDPAVYAGDAANKGAVKPPSNGIGTIMSYCHLRFANTMQMTFGPRPQARIRAGAEKTNCLKAPASPKIFMQYPVGKQNLVGGAQEEVRWTSARVSSVNVQYSADGGATWVDIQNGVIATARKVTWTVPMVSTSQLLVRVVDASNGQVFDQTEASLSIASPALSLSNPTGGERIGQKEQLDITWTKQLVTAVNVEYSTNGGTSWEMIQSGVTTSKVTWSVPEIVTSQAVIRVTDAANGSLVSQSQPFAIGKSIATLTSPNGGEKWGKGAKVWITWNSDFVSRVLLEYSTDGGATWKGVRKPVNTALDASLNGFQWTVPEDTATGKVFVRILNSSGKEELDRSDAALTLDLVSDVAEGEAAVNGLAITGISPNPAGEEAYLKFTNIEAGNSPVKIEVVDVTGNVVLHLEQISTGGEQTLKLNVKEIPQGVYMITLKNGMSQVSSSLRIVR